MAMSERQQKKPLGIPPFYWATPPKPRQAGFVNKQQRNFYFAITALKLVKIAAFAAIALLIIGMI
jgi:hypothetical protein